MYVLACEDILDHWLGHRHQAHPTCTGPLVSKLVEYHRASNRV
jgi:hypothetical protein